MIPLRDENPSQRKPIFTWTLIGICVLVYLMQIADPTDGITMKFAMVPARISHPDKIIIVRGKDQVQTPLGPQTVDVERELPKSALPEWLTIVSCIFLHGSVTHLLGNVWFLHIFGDNVEDRLGHIGYLLFYIGCGIAASLSQYVLDTESPIPTIGASGAIAGVMGAYLFLYPHAHIISLVPIAFFLRVVVIPAPVFLGIWFLIQFVQGTFSMGTMQAAGVAWWAHIGGFVAGAVVAMLVRRSSPPQNPRIVVVRPQDDRPWD
ncbi:MAG: rhomboid family intramembrane serine protease [Planctomycetota bacterium]